MMNKRLAQLSIYDMFPHEVLEQAKIFYGALMQEIAWKGALVHLRTFQGHGNTPHLGMNAHNTDAGISHDAWTSITQYLRIMF